MPAVLGLALTGSKVTVPVVEDRKELYAASSAIDAAVQLGVEDADVGVPGGPCPESVTTIVTSGRAFAAPANVAGLFAPEAQPASSRTATVRIA